MRILKIVAEGLVTSFRYPHFVQGVQPTYEMPPPATIYGHICSAVGEFIAPDSTAFAYTFTFEAKFFDYEHLHFFGKNPKMNPFNREQLFRPKLTLYLTNVDLRPFFERPRYPVVLGRSQDLMTYISVNEIESEQADTAYFSNTLLPLELSPQLGGPSYAVTMPRFLGENRVPQWGQYAILHGETTYPSENSMIMDGQSDFDIWVDPTADAKHPKKGLQRGLVWHRWQGEDYAP